MIDFEVLARSRYHPTAIRILEYLEERAYRAASPMQMATEFEEKIGDVAYHVTALRKAGLIRLVRTRPVRGAAEHFYTIRKEVRRREPKSQDHRD